APLLTETWMTYSPGSSKPIVAEKAPSPSVAGGAFKEASSDDVSTTSTSRGASASQPEWSRVEESPTSMFHPLGLSVLGSQISVPCVGSSSSEGGGAARAAAGPRVHAAANRKPAPPRAGAFRCRKDTERSSKDCVTRPYCRSWPHETSSRVVNCAAKSS